MKEEYTVEIYDNEDNWVEQVDVFHTYEEAEKYTQENASEDLEDGDRYSIWCIEYDENENEIKSYPVY